MKPEIKNEELHIGGMSCSSCETKIENKLKKLDGVLECKASFSNAVVSVTYDSSRINIQTITSTIEKLDYTVKSENTTGDSFSKNDKAPISATQLIGIGVVVFAAYVITKNTEGFNFIPEVNQSMGYGILFMVGLLTSLHCMAMCGGINLSQCVSYSSNSAYGGNSATSKLKPSFLYNFGRIISYTVIGGVVGSIGSVVSFSGTAKGIVAFAAGIFMIIMGLNMLNIFPWLRKINPKIPKIFRKSVNEGKSNKGPLYVGLLNGLMPCGPLQAMQLYALGTGSFTKGALSMFFFSLGTVPLMLGFGTLVSFLGGKYTQKMMKVSAVLVMMLGVIMAGRGLAVSGIGVPTLPTLDSQTNNAAKIEGNVQLVSTKLTGGEYVPIIVQKGIPVRWTIIAEKGDLNGCNNPLTIPKFNIKKKLVPGENVIEFTPNEEGNIVYTCWMGMIRSNIAVVSDITKEKSIENPNIENTTPKLKRSGGCCGG